MEERGAWPYLGEEPLRYLVREPPQYQEPHRTMGNYLDPLSSDYGPPIHAQGPPSPYNRTPQHGPPSPDNRAPQHDPPSSYNRALHHNPSSIFNAAPQYEPPHSPYNRGPQHDPDSPYNRAPQHDPHSPFNRAPHHDPHSPYNEAPEHGPHYPYNKAHHDPHSPYNRAHHDPQSPYNEAPQHGLNSHYNGPSSLYFPEDLALHPGPPYYNHGPSHEDDVHAQDPPLQHETGNFWQPPALEYSTEESEFGEHEDEDDIEEEEDDEESGIVNNLEEALQGVNIQLPRLAVTAPPSVLPPKIMSNKRKLRDAWLEMDEFKSWLARVDGDPTRAYCTKCQKTFAGDLTTVKRHMNTQIHADAVNSIPQAGRETPDLRAQISYAYILMICFIAEHNLSFLLADHMTDLYKAMFPDSAIAN